MDKHQFNEQVDLIEKAKIEIDMNQRTLEGLYSFQQHLLDGLTDNKRQIAGQQQAVFISQSKLVAAVDKLSKIAANLINNEQH